MGQIKNIKLHIVTDIKSTKRRREHKRLVNATTNHTPCVYVVVVRHTTSRRKPVRHVVTQVQETEVSTGVPRPREKTTGTGRMRHLKKVHRRSMNGFREGN